MWTFIYSLFGSKTDPEDLSLENACNVLKEIETNHHQSATETKDDVSNTFSSRVGTITQKSSKKYVIDNIYVFDKEEYSFELDSKVTFDLIISEGKEKVLNIKAVDNDWDVSDIEASLWNDRIVIAKVEKRVDRKLYLSPGDLILDMNNTSLEFLPIVGDWLELSVKCTIDENVLNLSGKVIEIDRASPVRPHIESGRLTNWNNVAGTGMVNKNIFFNRESLSCGYIPVVGDKVVAQIIESEQNKCIWRALKIIPEYMKARTGNNNSANLKLPDFMEDYTGLEITGLNVYFEKLGVTKEFDISISVTSDEVLILKNIKFLNNNSQCKILFNIEKEISISKDRECIISCQCTSKSMGLSKDFLLFSFANFNIGKWVNINVMLNHRSSNGFYEKQHSYRVNQHEGNQIIKGRPAGPRFLAVSIPNYTVPQKLFDNVSKVEFCDIPILMEELKITKPVLFSNLSFINYEDRFHTLLHLDEIANLIAVRTYDQEKACFISNAEFLMLEVENLSERRPSIVIGDKIIATDPLNTNKTDFEGSVQKVGAKHVYLRFSQLFHDQYTGEDYSIRVVPSRTTYRRQHHAIYLAARNMGPDLLFPSKMLLKEAQLELECSAVDFNKIIGSAHSNEQQNSDSKMNLEWYNKKLNHPQQNAVKNILRGEARPMPYIIFGPPGTGKTVTIIETILQLVRLIPQSRLLITAPSNSAADLIALRLIETGVLKPGDLVRMVSHNYAMSENIPPKLVPYCGVGGSAKEGTTSGQVLMNGILTECNKTMIGRHRLTVCTCFAAGQLFTMGFSKGHFSHIIIDEAAQAAEPEVMIPLSFLDRQSGQVILAGDPMQLGPVIICKLAEQLGLNESYIERLMNRFPYVRDMNGFEEAYGYDPRLVTKLVYNYRSLPDILGLYDSLFYNNELIPTIDNESSKEARLIKSLADILPKTASNTVPRLVFHGVEGENYQTRDSPSWFNPHEAAQVFYYVNELYRLGLKVQNIGIITPYIKQVKEIRSVLIEAEFDIPRIGSVEDFQGQEFDVIILSTVRTCQQYVAVDVIHRLGFITSPKRLNVAISRAKSLLIIIGNPNLLCSDTYWRSVVKYCMERGCYTGCELSV